MKKLNLVIVLSMLLNAVIGTVPVQASTISPAQAAAPVHDAPPPPLPSSFYGTVQLNGATAPVGTLVSAWINGVKYAETAVSSSGFVLDVPGDELDTPMIEGGHEGQVIVFRVGGYAASRLAVWHSGIVVNLDLAAIVADAPDLALVKDDNQTSALPGDVLTYTVTLFNLGNRAATGIVLTDTLPANTTFVSASDGGSVVDAMITWPSFDLAVDAALTRTVQVQVNDWLPVETSAITNTVAAIDDGTHGIDPTSENNTASDVDAVPDVLYRAALIISRVYPDETSLVAALEYLAQTVEELETTCAGATQLPGPGQAACSTDLRDHVVSGALAVVNHSGSISPYVTADETLQQVAQNLSTETYWPGIQAELSNVRNAVAELQTQLVTVANYNARTWFDPGMRVMLNNGPATLHFNLANEGRLTSTYSITLTTSAVISAPISPTYFEWTLAPGTSLSAPILITPTELGMYKLQADVTTLNASGVPSRQAQAGVLVVDALLQLTNVTARPAFVEYQSGVSPALTVRVANVANMPIDATARVRVIDADGTPVFTSTSPIQISSALLPIDYSLCMIDYNGLITGKYTVSVVLLEIYF
jgi:uncharacterized repeat protein (TIGR01451 family)